MHGKVVGQGLSDLGMRQSHGQVTPVSFWMYHILWIIFQEALTPPWDLQQWLQHHCQQIWLKLDCVHSRRHLWHEGRYEYLPLGDCMDQVFTRTCSSCVAYIVKVGDCTEVNLVAKYLKSEVLFDFTLRKSFQFRAPEGTRVSSPTAVSVPCFSPLLSWVCCLTLLIVS